MSDILELVCIKKPFLTHLRETLLAHRHHALIYPHPHTDCTRKVRKKTTKAPPPRKGSALFHRPQLDADVTDVGYLGQGVNLLCESLGQQLVDLLARGKGRDIAR